MRSTKRSTRWSVAAGVVALLAAVPVFTTIARDAAEANTSLPGDGTTSASAGASCWGIKQAHPSSANGIYWLNTAALERPTQFYCDMTTQGGGWVLVGRGREGWTFNPFGQGSPQTVRNTVSGPAAFAPASLPSSTVEALLNGQPVNTLDDGIRLERATNTSGSNTQRYQLFPRYAEWTWSFAAGQLLNRVVIDGTSYNGSNTRDTAASVAGQTTNQLSGTQGVRRMFTFQWSSHGNKAGFSFGSGVSGGSNSSTNHLWTNASEGSPIPFTRVWLRPKIANDQAGFTPLPAEGFPAEAKPAVLKNRSELAPWGVVGMDRTGETTIEPWHTNVLSLKVHGDRTYVGGRFTGVQQGPNNPEVSQPFLAAFTLDGQFVSTFRPQVNGRVWDIVATDDGKIIIAGDFTSVNGSADAQGIAALDATTGQLVPGFKARAFRADGGRSFVRALDIRDGVVYAGGNFNRFHGGTWNVITTTNAVSFSASNGTPALWRPRPNGQVVRLDVSDDASRVLLAGYFEAVNNDTNHRKFAITDAATGNPVAGIGPWTSSVGSSNRDYQQAVEDLGDGRIVVGGSEHNIQVWNWNRTSLLDAAVTKQGGDTQAIERFGDITYIGCHCGDWVYEGTNNWTSPSDFRSVEPINLVGAWDTETWEYQTDWYPSSLKGARGEGVWAIDKDAAGCLWVGGDLNRGGWSGNAANDWLGGFARFCPDDTTPPTTPTNLTATPAGEGVKLDWGASTDASGTVSYDVYKDDRVIATVWGRTYTDPKVEGAARYTVRASDARGNRSASPAPISINGPSPVIAQPIAFKSTWRYLADGSDQGTAWRQPQFDHNGWPTGAGKLGWGRSDITTVVGNVRPVTTYYRHQFQVANAASVRMLELQLYNMQGAVIYVNGIEAGRLNMPAGAITSTTGASGWLSAAEENAIKTITVPGSLLVNGTNTIAVESHNVNAGASRSQFDLQATLYSAGGDATAPSAPVLTATPGPGTVSLSWTPSSDDVALAGYQVVRDGQVIGHTGPLATTWTDGSVDLGVPHTYVVRAFDANGNVTASGPANVSPQADPNLLGFKSNWRWYYAVGGPAADWAAPAFDDSSWALGAAELGFGDNDEATVISTSPTPRPLTAYFRTEVDVPNPAAFTSVLASLIRDDAAVVYVNGVEVARDNLPEGPISYSTPALRGITTRAEEVTPVPFTIPSSAFQPGRNVIAVEIHLIHEWSGDLSMDLRLVGQP
jgi:trimeric autotransporter adhesin